MSNAKLSPELIRAIEKIRAFVETVTGESASDAEIALALTRYFVLNEIASHIEMEREKRNNVTNP